MRLVRFMSAHEIIRLLDGQTVQNDTVHRTAGQNSDSVGFCFAIASGKDGIYEAAQRLSGVTTMDICLLGKLKRPTPDRFKYYKAFYAAGYLEELATVEYSLQDFADWKIYAPEPPGPEYLVKIISSQNWQRPQLVKST